MLTFRDFGIKGGLGNQFFQLCSLVGIAENRGFEWGVPTSIEGSENEIALFRYFLLEDLRASNNFNQETRSLRRHWSRPNRFLDTTGVRFDNGLKNRVPDERDISAYLQSWRYFHEFRARIQGQFYVKSEFRSPSEDLDYIAVHVRRGDYLSHRATHRVLPVDYYKTAVRLLPKLPIKFVVQEADREWILSSTLATDPSAEIVSGSEIHDWQVIAGARYAIIANSTFSYSAAYCSTTIERVIAPKVWFGWSYPSWYSRDICPPDWVLL